VGFLKGYKPFILEKSDLKRIEKFSDVESKDSKIVDDVMAMVTRNGFEGVIFVLQKHKKYKSVYIFKTEVSKNKTKILRYYKSVTMAEVPGEVINEFEKEIISQLKEFIYTDDLWERAIWNGRVIKPKIIRFGSISLPVGILGTLIGIVLSVVTGNYIWLAFWTCFGFIGGSLVLKIMDKEK